MTENDEKKCPELGGIVHLNAGFTRWGVYLVVFLMDIGLSLRGVNFLMRGDDGN